jgi:hypothetical protein
MRKAWNVRVAGWIRSRRPETWTVPAIRRRPLLAVAGDHVREFPLVQLREQVCRRARTARVQAHVQRALLAEREAAVGAVELHRGDAEVEQDAVDRSDAEAIQDVGEVREVRSHERRPPERAGVERCARVRVDCDEPAARAEPRVDRPRMSAGTEGRVDVRPAATDREALERLGRHDGDVGRRPLSRHEPVRERGHQ